MLQPELEGAASWSFDYRVLASVDKNRRDNCCRDQEAGTEFEGGAKAVDLAVDGGLISHGFVGSYIGGSGRDSNRIEESRSE